MPPELVSSRRCDGTWPIQIPGGSPRPRLASCGNIPRSTSPGPERRRPPRSWLLLTGLLVTLALVGGVVVGAVAWSDDRPARVTNGVAGTASGGRAPGTTTVAPVATPACKTAVDRANAMLASAVRLREALAEHGRILRDPSNRGLSGDEVLERLAPSQRTGSSESARFDRALDEYRQVVDQCGLRLP